MITRNNYEEFFLLYVDNELSAADKHAVEEFVGANPDLKEEWEAILQCRLVPGEEEVFGDRKSLLQPSEETLLLYIDGELDAAGNALVEGPLPQARLQDLEWLRHTVSQPDLSIICPDKESLYRRRRVIMMPWMRIAAAAVTIGAILLLVFRQDPTPPTQKNSGLAVTRAYTDTLHSTKSNIDTGTHTSDPTQTTPDNQIATLQPGSKSDGSTSNGSTPTGPNPSGSNVTGSTPTGPTSTGLARIGSSRTGSNPATSAGKPANGSRSTNPIHDNTLAQSGSTQQPGSTGRSIASTQTSNTAQSNVPDQATAQTANLASANQSTANQTSTHLKAETTAAIGNTTPDRIATTTNNNITGDHSGKTPSFATQALLAEAGVAPDDEEDPVSPKKNKLRGFFRKVSRVIEKRTTRDDDENHKVYLGGFAIK